MRRFGNTKNTFDVSRRGLLRGAAASAAISAGSATMMAGKARAQVASGGHPVLGDNPVKRASDAFKIKVNSARRYLEQRLAAPATNGDEGLYADKRGSFSKCLVHNDLGEVDAASYASLLTALGSGDPADFDAIQMTDTGTRSRGLVNPQAAYQFPDAGPDGQGTRIRPAPTFAGDETAGEMQEVYWKALFRDVPFIKFDVNGQIPRAIADMNAAPFVVGNPVAGQHTLQTIFRGETAGDRTGPYVSQFLWKPVPYGNGTMEQRYPVPPIGGDYMTEFGEWLTVQRGGVVGTDARQGNVYIHNGRSLAEYVHYDFSYQAYLNAALIILGFGPDFFDTDNPMLGNGTQEGFSTFGGPDVLDMVACAANQALSGAWYQKWLINRRARPEVYGGRLHLQQTGEKDYGLPSFLTDTLALERVKRRKGSYLLPMAYAEGSPTHPAYPAGHACMAGACATVLKAYFNEDALVPAPVESNATGTVLRDYAGDLTIGGEINKLANNISLGRDWAGVHYRSDGIEGMNLGEQMAIDMLQDHSAIYNERFSGFNLTKFD
ncbi:MAG: vanadium-dependent haloperoxidase, partial [Pseudomonadota bacterium]